MGAFVPRSTIEYPFDPPSDDPTASVSTMVGSSSMSRSFSEGEKSAAVLPIPNSDDRSYSASGASRASIIGRAIASPVIMIMLIFSCSTRRHVRSASNLAMSTTRDPRNAPLITPHCVAPCISGAIGIIVGCPPPASACAFAASTRLDGPSTRSFVTGSMPPPSAKNTSS